MVLMTLDHVSLQFNADRVSMDSAQTWVSGSALPLDQFLTRWVTHLCAPTFLFLAGAGVALSTRRRMEAGVPAWTVDRDLLIRGILIVLLDVVYMSSIADISTILQVLYAIGMAMIFMIPLRRLDPRVLLALGLAWFALGELLTGWIWPDPASNPAFVPALFVAPFFDGKIYVLYPFVPWLAMMMIGWAFGHWLHDHRDDRPSARTVLLIGLASLTVFLVVRGLNGYGNMFLLREDGSLAHWLHTSKYPPSLTFATLELGIMLLCIAGFMALETRISVASRGPLLVFGQTALFFYIAHQGVLFLCQISGLVELGSLPYIYGFTVLLLLFLYPICLGYRAVKRRYPTSFLRYI